MAGIKETVKEDNRGTTLVEMIVTFALVGIFLAAAVSVISSAVVMHSELTGAMYAQNVGELLLDKITGELAAAQPEGNRAMVIGDTSGAGGTEGNGAAFHDREGNAVSCMVQEGLLVFHYQESVQVDEQGVVQISEAHDWMLDEKAYMGFRITDMQIQRLEDKNVLEVTIKIKNLKTGFEYSTSRCTQCYNFVSESDYRKIVEGSIWSS